MTLRAFIVKNQQRRDVCRLNKREPTRLVVGNSCVVQCTILLRCVIDELNVASFSDRLGPKEDDAVGVDA